MTLENLRNLIAEWVISENEPEPKRLDVVLDVEHLLDAVQALIDSGLAYLATITGLDHGPDADQLEVLYHFCAGAEVLTLRIALPRQQPGVPSVAEIIPAARIYERELHEMFGVALAGETTIDPLLLPDEWPDDKYPMRKDWQGNDD